MNETRLRLKQRSFLIHFLLGTNGSSPAEFCVKSSFNCNINININININTRANTIFNICE
ncbi:MAG: hypothetical protein V4447_17020 [Pseudomonadota bacterium]